MRWVAIVLAAALCINLKAQDVERVVALNAGSTELSLPKGTEGVWIYLPYSHSPPEGHFLPANGNGLGVSFKDVLRYIPSVVAARLKTNGRWSSIQEIVLDDLSIKSNLVLNACVVGSIPDNGSVEMKFRAADRKPLLFEVVANRMGSKLDPTLEIVDETGREIARADDDLLAGRDCRLRFVPPRTGMYKAVLRDVAGGAGADYFFCLRSREETLIWIRDSGHTVTWRKFKGDQPFEPDISNLSCSNDQHVPLGSLPIRIVGAFDKRGDKYCFRFKASANQKLIIWSETRAMGFGCDAGLRLLHENGELVGESIGGGADGASITNRFEQSGIFKVEIREISGLSGEGLGFFVGVDEAKPGVVLSTEAEKLAFSKDGEAKIKIACKRHEYDGVVKLEVDGLPEGVSVMDGVIAKGKNETELKLKRAKEVEAFQIRIDGTIETDSAKFPVSTMPALRKLYPLQMFPCAAMDGWIAVNPASE